MERSLYYGIDVVWNWMILIWPCQDVSSRWALQYKRILLDLCHIPGIEKRWDSPCLWICSIQSNNSALMDVGRVNWPCSRSLSIDRQARKIFTTVLFGGYIFIGQWHGPAYLVCFLRVPSTLPPCTTIHQHEYISLTCSFLVSVWAVIHFEF